MARAAAEALADELLVEAGLSAGGTLATAAAVYTASELFKKATKWDKLARAIQLVKEAAPAKYSEAKLNELVALYVNRKNPVPGSGADSLEKL